MVTRQGRMNTLFLHLSAASTLTAEGATSINTSADPDVDMMEADTQHTQAGETIACYEEEICTYPCFCILHMNFPWKQIGK